MCISSVFTDVVDGKGEKFNNQKTVFSIRTFFLSFQETYISTADQQL